MARRRRLWQSGLLALSFMLMAAGCSSDDDDASVAAESEPSTSDDTDTAEQVAAGEADTADVERIVDEIDAALDEESNRLIEAEIEWAHWGFSTGALPPGPNMWLFCTRIQEQKQATLDAMPERLGAADLDAPYAVWRDTQVRFLAELSPRCEQADERGGPFVLTQAEAEDLVASMTPFEEAERLACFDALEALEGFGPLNCTREPDSDTGFTLDEPGPEIYELLDVDPDWMQDGEAVETPTGDGGCPASPGLFGERVQVGPDPADCLWFARPFTIDHPEGVLVQGIEEILFIVPLGDGPTLTIWGVDQVADPAELHREQPARYVEAPEEPVAWVESLPLKVIETTTIDLGGQTATRFIVQGDEQAIREATGEQSFAWIASDIGRISGVISGGVMEAPPGLPEDQRDAPAFNEPTVYALWHILTPSGPVIAEMQTFSEFTTELDFAEGVLAAITWR
ncbi:MAG: hypothetical protein AAF467_15615 [Actinomycetota bacterium]